MENIWIKVNQRNQQNLNERDFLSTAWGETEDVVLVSSANPIPLPELGFFISPQIIPPATRTPTTTRTGIAQCLLLSHQEPDLTDGGGGLTGPTGGTTFGCDGEEGEDGEDGWDGWEGC